MENDNLVWEKPLEEWAAVKVLSGMRIALPDWVCKRLGIQIGNYIRLRWNKNALWLEPVEFVIKSDQP